MLFCRAFPKSQLIKLISSEDFQNQRLSNLILQSISQINLPTLASPVDYVLVKFLKKDLGGGETPSMKTNVISSNEEQVRTMELVLQQEEIQAHTKTIISQDNNIQLHSTNVNRDRLQVIRRRLKSCFAPSILFPKESHSFFLMLGDITKWLTATTLSPQPPRHTGNKNLLFPRYMWASQLQNILSSS